MPTFAELERAMTRSSRNAIYRMRRRVPPTTPRKLTSLALEAYRRDLSNAIFALSRESKMNMSVQDLKQRFASVPGIENLSVRFEGSSQVLSLGGPFITVPIGAADDMIEAAIRNLPPPRASVPQNTLTPAVASPPIVPSAAQPVPAPGSVNPAAAHLNVKDILLGHSGRMASVMDAQLALLQSIADNQVNTVVAGIGSVAKKLESQTDEFKAMMGQFTNDLGI